MILLTSCETQLKGVYVWKFKRAKAKHTLYLKRDSTLIIKTSIQDRQSPSILKSKYLGKWTVFNDSLLIMQYRKLRGQDFFYDTLFIFPMVNSKKTILKKEEVIYRKKRRIFS